MARRVASSVLVHAAEGSHRAPLDSPGAEDDRFLVAVTFTVGRFGVPVHAEFSSPDPRTIMMEIVDGEGAGSVVETHATPVRAGHRRPAAHGGDRGGDGSLGPVGVRADPPGCDR